MDATHPNIPDPDQLERKLRDGSAEIGGERWVSATRAMRIIGCPRATYHNWHTHRGLPIKHVKCKRTRKTPNGVIACVPLRGLLDCVAQYDARPDWSHDEDELIEERYGQWRTATIADKLGRSERAVRDRANHLGLTLTSAQGLLNTADVARLLDVTPSRVNHWCNGCEPALKHRRVPSGRAYIQIDPEDLLAFLQRRADIASRISHQAMRRLQRRAMPLHQRRKAVAA